MGEGGVREGRWFWCVARAIGAGGWVLCFSGEGAKGAGVRGAGAIVVDVLCDIGPAVIEFVGNVVQERK